MKISKRAVDAAEPGRHYDDSLPGFGLYVGPSGAKSYFFEYRPGRGRAVAKRRMTIGKHGVLTPDLARKEALRLAGIVAAGGDPLADRQQPGETVAALMALWLAEIEATRKPKTLADYRWLVDRHVLPAIGRKDVRGVDRSTIARLHHALRDRPYLGNYVVRMLGSFFTWCERRGYRQASSNPARLVSRYREQGRERFLSPRELHRLGRALRAAERAGINPLTIAAVRLLLLTGARLNEILTLRWHEIDFAAGCARLSDSKTGKKVLRLNAPALAILASLPRLADNPHVIVGDKPGGHMTTITKPWQRIRKAALLSDVRLHDLRHSFASVAVSGGASLQLVGGLLGHSQPQTTARYAHLSADPLQQVAEAVGAHMEASMSGKGADVVRLPRNQ